MICVERVEDFDVSRLTFYEDMGETADYSNWQLLLNSITS